MDRDKQEAKIRRLTWLTINGKPEKRIWYQSALMKAGRELRLVNG